MGLLVSDHLQPVLDPAQELVGCRQFVARLKGDPVARRQHVQRVQRRPHPQLRMAAAGNQLLGLGEKLDLADAAATDLDVVALDRNLALAAIGLHLPLHVMDVGERGKIQMLAPDERREFGDQRLARLGVAGARPRLDHRRALPGPPFPLVIMQRRVGRNRHLRRGRIGPQAQIDAKHIAVAGALLQQPCQRLRHAHEERRRLDIGDQRRGGGIEEHDQVDVAGIVQFARAHLAHGEHDQATALLRPVRIGGGHPAARDLLAQQEAQAPSAPRLTARSVSAAVTRITGQTPPMSHSAISSAASDFMRRSRCITSVSPGGCQHVARGFFDQRGKCDSGSHASSRISRAASARIRSNR